MGTESYSFLSIKNGKAETDNALIHVFDLMSGSQPKYTLDNKTITKETYDKTLYELLTKHIYTIKSYDHGYPLTDDFIEKIISD